MAAAKASLPLLALLAVLAVWQLAALRGLPDYLLGPLEILKHFAAALGSAELYENIGASLARSKKRSVFANRPAVSPCCASRRASLFRSSRCCRRRIRTQSVDSSWW